MLRAGLFRVSLRACVRARMRHGCRGARRMRDLQLGPDHGGRRVVRSTEAWRVESAMAVGGPERRREGHAMQDGSGELLIFCHCKLIYSMGPLLSPPVVHASCALWGRDVPVFRAPFCPFYIRSLSSLCPRQKTSHLFFLYLGSRAHSLPSTSLPGCNVPSVVPPLRHVTLCLCCAFFSPAKRGISLFFFAIIAGDRVEKFTCASSPCGRAPLRESGPVK